MQSLRVRLNESDLVWTAQYPVAWLSWDVMVDTQQEHYGTLCVSGAIEVREGGYDIIEWLYFHPLPAACMLEFQVLPTPGTSAYVARRTHEEQEELRLSCAAAEAAGEVAAASIGPRRVFRDYAGLSLAAPGRQPIHAHTNEHIDLVTTSGLWSPEHKPDQWRVRISTVPPKGVPEAGSTYFWVPTAAPVLVELDA